VPEIHPEEQDAIAAVMDHLRASYVGLLKQCRNDMCQRAIDEPDLHATMKQNWNRDDSIWKRGYIDLPLLIESSYVERAYFWIDEVPERKGTWSLVGDLSVQARRRQPLLELGENPPSPVMLTEDGRLRVIVDLHEGAKFEDLAKLLVDPLWPLAISLREALRPQRKRPSPPRSWRSSL
jgi:hypothetical protein